MHRMRAFAAIVAALAISIAAAAPLVAQSLPAPEQYLGFRVGTDRKLATWPQVVEYMHMAARASDRVRVEELGKSTNSHPFLLLTISSPKNLARLEQIQADQKRLAYPYELSEKEADEIAARNPAVILITLTIHSTEIGSTQMSLELVHRLATENSPYIQRILDNVVFLLAPSVNPDGQVLVIDWYNKNIGTEFEYSPMPWLYHPYTGHDNNRDAYMLTQKETQYVTRVLYK
ncbi:MAG: M14 family zinc carboxypeptidase, partial [Candidatus Acidiferrales bacterium]